MTDPYYVYRPILNLIGYTEGTDKGRGYNETLAYGAYTGGDVNLVGMTLTQVDALQTKMLQHPKNKWNSSAVGRSQIIRTTMRSIRKILNLPGTLLYDEKMQDRMTCYLLGARGIDKWLAGRLETDTLIDNLAAEWASLPMRSGKGRYDGQHAAVTPTQVKTILAQVRKRHMEGQPVERVPVPVEKPVIPDSVEHEVKKKTNLWGRITAGVGTVGTSIGAYMGFDWQTVLVFGLLMLGGLIVVLLLRRQIVSAVKEIQEGLA